MLDIRHPKPRRAGGRSLSDFDLKTRMFRYPLSHMIYTEEFRALPRAVKDRLTLRLDAVLSGKDHSDKFAHLTAGDRKAIREILSETLVR